MTGEHVLYDEAARFSLGAEDSTPADAQLEADFARLTLIRTALAQGSPWARIGATLGMTGPQAKQHHKRLAARTRRAWYLHHNQDPPADGPPYVHELAAPEPGSRCVPYTITGPGVVDELDKYVTEAMQDPEFREAYEAAGD